MVVWRVLKHADLGAAHDERPIVLVAHGELGVDIAVFVAQRHIVLGFVAVVLLVSRPAGGVLGLVV